MLTYKIIVCLVSFCSTCLLMPRPYTQKIKQSWQAQVSGENVTIIQNRTYENFILHEDSSFLNSGNLHGINLDSNDIRHPGWWLDKACKIKKKSHSPGPTLDKYIPTDRIMSYANKS